MSAGQLVRLFPWNNTKPQCFSVTDNEGWRTAGQSKCLWPGALLLLRELLCFVCLRRAAQLKQQPTPDRQAVGERDKFLLQSEADKPLDSAFTNSVWRGEERRGEERRGGEGRGEEGRGEERRGEERRGGEGRGEERRGEEDKHSIQTWSEAEDGEQRHIKV